ncbi:MAG TPA: hypothetical protein VJ986_00125 [Gaiellaceae bacterium]|nr:hypothetical protein [Gaiellaceae bacterium]
MAAQTALALGLTLVSACLINWGYLTEHAAASRLPPLSPRRPLRSLGLLLASRRWLVGFGAETVGFGLYVVAVALAPLALVQAVAAGGIGVLAFLVSKTTDTRLARRETFGIAVAIGGLALLAVSLAGGTEHGTAAGWISISMWLGASVAAAALAVTSGAAFLGGGAAFGVAAGILFAAGDVSTKVMVEGGGHAVVAAAVIGFYGAGTIVLQMGFQRGRALTTAGIATLGTNAIPIAAAMTLFAEPLPAGLLGGVRVAAFAAVIVGAVALAPQHGSAPHDSGAPRSRPRHVRDGLGPAADPSAPESGSSRIAGQAQRFRG